MQRQTKKIKNTRRVDPTTGQRSNAVDAISRNTLYARRKVDPATGELSDAVDAISYNAFRKRKKVDPKTGEPSNADDAISYTAFRTRKAKVDPKTGEPSDADNAISYGTFRMRKKVDPKTGEPSDADNAISYSAFTQRSRKKVDPGTGKDSDADNAISYSTYVKRKSRNKKKVGTVTDDCNLSILDESTNVKADSLSKPKIKTKPIKKITPTETTREEINSSRKNQSVTLKLKAPKQKYEEKNFTLKFRVPKRKNEEECPLPTNKRVKLNVNKTSQPLITNEWSNDKHFQSAGSPPAEVKEEPGTEQPITEIDIKAFRKVAKILRGKNRSTIDCAYLTEPFLRYLQTGKMPSQPAFTSKISFDQFAAEVDYELTPVKPDPDAITTTSENAPISTIYNSTIHRSSRLGNLAPPGEIAPIFNGVTDLTTQPIIDIEHRKQERAHYTALNIELTKKAAENGGYVFGMCNLVLYGDATNPGHTLAFFASSTEVVYIDCQLDEPIIYDLASTYEFAQPGTTVTSDTFGPIVFYVPTSRPLQENTEVLSSNMNISINDDTWNDIDASFLEYPSDTQFQPPQPLNHQVPNNWITNTLKKIPEQLPETANPIWENQQASTPFQNVPVPNNNRFYQSNSAVTGLSFFNNPSANNLPDTINPPHMPLQQNQMFSQQNINPLLFTDGNHQLQHSNPIKNSYLNPLEYQSFGRSSKK